MTFEFITGMAGTGKSHLLRERMEQDSGYAVMTATTGVAAINLGEGVTTINSFLKFFDGESLQRAYEEGWLARRVLRYARENPARNVVIDEVSMLPARYLDLIVDAMLDAEKMRADYYTEEHGEIPGLIVTGDFCQLPPVKGQFAFYSKHWAKFEANTTKLTKNWRQTDETFLQALLLARKGRGAECARLLFKSGVTFSDTVDQNFDGTTLFPTNMAVNKYNQDRFDRINQPPVNFRAIRRGKQRGEWVNEIPDSITLKKGTLILILANEPQSFRYVNGDLAEILDVVTGHTEIDEEGEEKEVSCQPYIRVRLRRNGYEFNLRPIIREHVVYERPKEDEIEGFRPWYDTKKKHWVIGEVEYMPVRLGYASTIHKSQGLSLDSVQIDVRNKWAAAPAMVYVALSRSRTPNGVRIVGNPGILSSRIITSPDVKRWI